MINSTNRIYNTHREFKKKLDVQVNAIMRKKTARKYGSYRNRNIQTVDCTKCLRKMSRDFADKQLFYGRKDAPICIPCILGIKRKEVVIKDTDGYAKYKKTYNRSRDKKL